MIINDKKPIYKAYFGDTQIITNVGSEGTGGGADGFDFSVLGYDTTLNNSCNDKIQADIDYSKTILDNWNPNTASAYNAFQNDTKMVYCPNIDTSNVLNMQNMFYGCKQLTTIPLLNTSNVTNMKYMFGMCETLTTIPLFNTINVTTMSQMFYNCKSLTTIPQLETSNVLNMEYLFYGCDIVHFPHLDTSNVTTFYRIMYSGNSNLVSIPLLDFGNITNINNFNGSSNKTYVTDLGGFKNLKIDWNDNYGLNKFPNLTYESVMNVINNLYDFRANGDTTTTRTIQFNANSKALLSESDIAIATAKGWIIS